MSRSLSEFSLFMQFCFDLRRLLEMIQSPILQSAIWNHYSYWFEIIGDKLNKQLGEALSKFLEWRPAREDLEAIDEVHTYVTEARMVLRDLTSRRFAEPIDLALRQAIVAEQTGNLSLARQYQLDAGPSQPEVSGFIMLDSNNYPIAYNTEALRILGLPQPSADAAPSKALFIQIRNTLIDARTTNYLEQFISGEEVYRCRAFHLSTGSAEVMSCLLLERKSPPLADLSTLLEQYELTGREKQAVELLVEGLTSKEIANRMNISPNTIKRFLRLVMARMNISRDTLGLLNNKWGRQDIE
jgi:DNA-binding CsgD family transcriptional regulator